MCCCTVCLLLQPSQTFKAESIPTYPSLSAHSLSLPPASPPAPPLTLSPSSLQIASGGGAGVRWKEGEGRGRPPLAEPDQRQCYERVQWVSASCEALPTTT